MSEGREIEVSSSELIVSMTDIKGHLVYVNDIFCSLAGYSREELIGQPHNIIRHPDMPRVVFKLLWDRVKKGEIIYAFVKNRAQNGSYYWVKAYVKPILKNGQVEKIVSYRKPVTHYVKKVVSALYEQLVRYERNHSVEESVAFLNQFLEERNMSYDQLMDRISNEKQIFNVAALKVDVQAAHNAHVILRTNVLNRLKNDDAEVSVIDPCCCPFGKWLEASGGESYMKHHAWSDVVNAHKGVHHGLQEYVKQHYANVGQGVLDETLNVVMEKTEEVFTHLDDVIDHCE